MTLDAVDRIPSSLWLEQVKGIYRMKRSKDHPNKATSGNGYIVLYNGAFATADQIARFITHELAHEYYRNLSDKDRLSYQLAAGWGEVRDTRTGKNIIVHARPSGYVASDGKTSPAEDFANNIEYFLFEENTLLRLTPHAHTWIKTHFGATFKLGR